MNFSLSDGIQKHEKIVIVGVLVIAGWFGYNHIIGWLDNRAKIADAQAQAVLQVQILQNKTLAEQVAASQAAYEMLIAKLDSNTRAILASQAKLVEATKKQQEVDKTLPPDLLAARWASLVKQPTETIIPQPDSYVVAPQTAVATVVQLEEIPLLQSEVQTQKEIVVNKETQIDSLSNFNSGLQNQVSGLNEQIVAQTEACKTEIAVVKAQARKSKLKWFGAGVVVGFIGRNLLGL